MFARTQDQLTHELASLKGLPSVMWCTTVSGAGSLAYCQASVVIDGIDGIDGSSSKQFSQRNGSPFGLGLKLGNPEDRA